MRIARVFPTKTTASPDDDMAFFGPPPEGERYDEAHVSVIFTWDIDKAKMLADQWATAADRVLIGGPAMGSPAGEFEPGMYIASGRTVTSRGCPNACKWCLVHEREGGIRELGTVQPGSKVQDNNFLACSIEHRARVYEMLRSQTGVEFCGGLESRRLTEWDVSEILKLRGHPLLFFACDSRAGMRPLRRAMEMLQGYPRRYKRCYVLIGGHTDETIEEAEQRIIDVWKAGAWPKALLYLPPDRKRLKYGTDWVLLKERWNPPQIVYKLGAMIDAGSEKLIFKGRWV